MVMTSFSPAPGTCRLLHMTHTTPPTTPISNMVQAMPQTMALTTVMENEVGGGREGFVEIVGE